MPQKTLEERLHQARKQGRPAVIREAEVRGSTRRSAHSEKRSSALAGQVVPEERHASRRRPPGRGRSTAKMPTETPASRKRAERDARPRNRKGKLQKLGGNRNVPKGRKKAPGQLHVKRVGGPFKRSRLHGG